MNKKYIFFIIIFIIAVIGSAVYFRATSNNSNSNNEIYEAQRVSSNNTNSTQTNPPAKKEIETEIASYTSKIKTKDDGRQTNITLTCTELDDTIVESGSTFSFCDTVGKSTESKGYELANVFQDGIEVEALGGGKCQVSSTLYNAVLEIPELEVTERHPHSGDVYYVPEGKDAAVAYGSYDFKFKNNLGTSIKIKAENTEDDVTIKIIKLE